MTSKTKLTPQELSALRSKVGRMGGHATRDRHGGAEYYRQIGKVGGVNRWAQPNQAPAYCTQNNGDCQTCSLVNYGRDCQNNPITQEGGEDDTG